MRLLALALAAVAAAAATQQGKAVPVIKFTPKEGVPTYAVREPVLRFPPGTVIETQTFSIYGLLPRRQVSDQAMTSGVCAAIYPASPRGA